MPAKMMPATTIAAKMSAGDEGGAGRDSVAEVRHQTVLSVMSPEKGCWGLNCIIVGASPGKN